MEKPVLCMLLHWHLEKDKESLEVSALQTTEGLESVSCSLDCTDVYPRWHVFQKQESRYVLQHINNCFGSYCLTVIFFLATLPASKFYLMCLLPLIAFRHQPNPLFPRDAALLISLVDRDHTLCSAQSYSLHSVSPSQSASANAPRNSLWCPLNICK